MKLKRATNLLKAVLVFGIIAVGLVAFVGVPAFMKHVIHVRPALAVWESIMNGYAILIALPVWVAIVLLWQVFDTIPNSMAFSLPNMRRFRQIMWLATGDLGLVVVLWVFLIISEATPPFIMMSMLLATLVGIVAVIVFYVLAGLVQNAAELKQDSDLTI